MLGSVGSQTLTCDPKKKKKSPDRRLRKPQMQPVHLLCHTFHPAFPLHPEGASFWTADYLRRTADQDKNRRFDGMLHEAAKS